MILFPHLRPEDQGSLGRSRGYSSPGWAASWAPASRSSSRSATEVDEIVGVDFVPPRRRLRRSEFKRIDPRDRDKLAEFVPDVRAPRPSRTSACTSPTRASTSSTPREFTEACTVTVLGAAARAGSLERVVVRSGLEVYGRGRGRPVVPDEDAPLAPTTPVRALGASRSRRWRPRWSAATASRWRRCGSRRCSGSHVPSPLGRLLRLPAVPVPALADPPFQLLHQEDAAHAMVEALLRSVDGPLNVVGAGRGERLAGGAARRPGAGPGVRARLWSFARAGRRARGRAGAAARARAHPARPGRRRRRVRVDVLGLAPAPVDAGGLHGAVRVGDGHAAAAGRTGRMSARSAGR